MQNCVTFRTFSASVGGKALYLAPKNGDDGAALAGVGLNWNVLPSLSVYEAMHLLKD